MQQKKPDCTFGDGGSDAGPQQSGDQIEVDRRWNIQSLPHKGQRRQRTKRRTTKMRCDVVPHRGYIKDGFPDESDKCLNFFPRTPTFDMVTDEAVAILLRCKSYGMVRRLWSHGRDLMATETLTL